MIPKQDKHLVAHAHYLVTIVPIPSHIPVIYWSSLLKVLLSLSVKWPYLHWHRLLQCVRLRLRHPGFILYLFKDDRQRFCT